MHKGKYIIVLVLMALFSNNAWATHSTGLDITYECIGGDSFFVQLSFYRDCDGIDAPGFGGEPLPVIDISSNSCAQNFTATFDLISFEEAGTVCPSLQTTCSGGTYPGIEEYIYGDTVVLPASCNDWIFSYGLCCRNNAISTIVKKDVDIYVEAKLDNIASSCNSSPFFSNTPVPFVCVGNSYCFNNGAVDPDGDSLAYHLVTPTIGPNAADTVKYVAGYSAQSPITSVPSLSLDPVTGDICMTPTMLEVTVMQVEIEEWRNGVLIGTVERDIQVRVIDCIVPNTLPTVNGINGTGVFTAEVCAGDSLCFYTESVDPDAGQNITMTWNAGISDATFDTTSGLLPVGNFCWVPDSTDISATPHCFTVTVVDDNCPFLGSQIFSFCITVIGYLEASTVAQDISCVGDCDGEAVTNIIGGIPPITYLWDDPSGQTSSTASNLCPGTYTVTVTDSLGCTSSESAIINSPNPIAFTLDSTAITCNGLDNGTATVTASGGTGTLSYLWNSIPNQTTAMATALSAGTYTITITDSNMCDTSASVIITEPPAFSTSISDSTNITCNGLLDGSAVVSINGGTTPYSILWDAAAGNQTNDTAINLAAGTYQVVATDFRGCKDSVTVTLTQPPTLNVSISNQVDVDCFGGNNGSATASVSGGIIPYSILWDPATGGQTDSTATDLFAGTYKVYVTDSNLCQDSVPVTILEPASAISLTTSTNDVSCFGGDDGNAVVTPSGGTPPYTYLWDASTGSQTDSTATNLSAGTYSVTVFDMNDCTHEPSIVINEPTILSVLTSFSDVSCFDGNNGSATVSINGGIEPYSILWDAATGSQTDTTAINLEAGTYLVTITDSSGCDLDTNVTVNEPVIGLALTTSVTTPKCFGDTDGRANLSISGGTEPYAVLWDANANNQTDTIAINLGAGSYFVHVTDTNGCIDSIETIVNQPLLLSLDSSINAVSCFGKDDGSVAMIPQGGTLPYSYAWSPAVVGTTDSLAMDLAPGDYEVLVTDSNGCSDSISTTIIEPDPLALTVTPNDTICPGDSIAISALIVGGNGGYSYVWDQGLLETDTHNVSPDISTTYTVSGADSLGCITAMDSITIYVYSFDLSGLTLSSGGDICVGDTTTVDGNYTGGLGSFTFEWNQGLGTNLGTHSISPPDTTDYILTVTDQCNNTIADTITVNVNPYPVIDLLPLLVEGCAPLTVNFTDSLNDTTKMTYSWNFGDGSISSSSSPSYTYDEDGMYNISLSITSSEGCTSSSSINSIAHAFPNPKAEFDANPTITDTEDATITLTNLSEGATSYLWNFGNGDTSTTVDPSYTYSDTGVYIIHLLVTNQYGCSTEYELPITVNPFFTFDTPNVFTPNPNGGNGGYYDPQSLTNDIFYPFTEYVEEYQLLIFNRWGELIFESTDLAIGWDGYYRSSICQQDTYVWKVNLTYTNGQKISKVGDITLIR